MSFLIGCNGKKNCSCVCLLKLSHCFYPFLLYPEKFVSIYVPYLGLGHCLCIYPENFVSIYVPYSGLGHCLYTVYILKTLTVSVFLTLALATDSVYILKSLSVCSLPWPWPLSLHISWKLCQYLCSLPWLWPLSLYISWKLMLLSLALATVFVYILKTLCSLPWPWPLSVSLLLDCPTLCPHSNRQC